MKVIIAGSRDIDGIWGYHLIAKAMLASGWDDSSEENMLPTKVTEVVSGVARGVDQLGIEWALCNWLPWKEFPADWDKHGKAAGPIRNAEMADYADAAVVVMWKGGTPGSRNMIEQMKKRGKPVYIYEVERADD